MTTANPLPRLLNIDELAGYLGVTVRHVRRLVAERRIPYLKVGRLVRFHPDDVTGWLEEARHSQQSQPQPRPIEIRGSESSSSRPSAGRRAIGSHQTVNGELRNALDAKASEQ